MRELLVYLAKALVDQPDQVRIEEFTEDDGTVVFELSVAPDDVGKVIGRQGRIARALRTTLMIAGSRNNLRASLDIDG